MTYNILLTIAEYENSKEIRRSIQTIYKMLWDLLAMYESTDAYNNTPLGTSEGDIWGLLGNKLIEIKKELTSLFLGNRELTETLERIVDETEVFIRSYEIPGVVKRWKKINPNMLFFDCAFDLLENEPELYKDLCRGLSDCKLSCYPDEELLKAKKDYFERMKTRIERDNLRYSEQRVFQNELLKTLTLVFENDLKEYL